MKVKTIGRAVAAGLGVAVAVAMTATPAAADPPSGTYRILAGTGSDTTQDVMNGLGTVIDSGATLASWDARGSSQIKTKATPTCTFNRPNGSGAGRQALRAAKGEDLGGTNGGPGFYQGANVVGCADFARSSAYAGGTNPSPTGTYTYIPFAVDAVTMAVNVSGDLPLNVSFAQMQRVYKCFDTAIAGNPVVPRMIQADSGTWQFWSQRMQITEAEINLGDYPCMAADSDNNPSTPAVPLHNRVQEHDGTVLAGNLTHVVPFSAGQFIAQSRTATIANLTAVTVTDRRGPAYLVGLGSTIQPFNRTTLVLNTNFPLRRDVYNVVSTADLNNAQIDDTFTGLDSDVCTASVVDGGTTYNVIELFGFGRRTTQLGELDAACGYTGLRANS